jgi:hypothetical protein
MLVLPHDLRNLVEAATWLRPRPLMSQRGTRLQQTLGDQLDELLATVAALDAQTIGRPCTGREKLGDGTVGACAQHTADNYERIIVFLAASPDSWAAPEPVGQRPHRVSRWRRSAGHQRREHARPASHDGGAYSAHAFDRGRTHAKLRALRDQMNTERVTDSQLDTIPPAGSFRFCDGERTLERVVLALLAHQRHQLDALTAALA